MEHQNWNTVKWNKKESKQNPPGTAKFREVDGDNPPAPETISHSLRMSIQKARVAKKISQKDLASRMNVQVSTINMYESGKAVPNSAFDTQVFNKWKKLINEQHTYAASEVKFSQGSTSDTSVNNLILLRDHIQATIKIVELCGITSIDKKCLADLMEKAFTINTHIRDIHTFDDDMEVSVLATKIIKQMGILEMLDNNIVSKCLFDHFTKRIQYLTTGIRNTPFMTLWKHRLRNMMKRYTYVPRIELLLAYMYNGERFSGGVSNIIVDFDTVDAISNQVNTMLRFDRAYLKAFYHVSR